MFGEKVFCEFISEKMMFGWFRKKDKNNEIADWERSRDPHLMVDHDIFIMTQSQVEKVLTSCDEFPHLVDEGFKITTREPDRLSAVIEKENYYCEFSVFYELEDRTRPPYKVKKVCSELNGEWSVGKKSKKVKGGTKDAYQKWLDWDDAYFDAASEC